MSEAFRSQLRWRTKTLKSNIISCIRLDYKFRLTKKKTVLFPEADLRQLRRRFGWNQTDRQKQADRQQVAQVQPADRCLQVRYLAEGGVLRLMQVTLRCSTR